MRGGDVATRRNVEHVCGTPTTRPPKGVATEGTSRKKRLVELNTGQPEARRTPAPRLLLARLADAYGTTMGVARHNNFMTHEDQLLVAVEAGRVVRRARVPVRLAGGRRHRPQRWRRGCPTGAMSVCRSHGGWRASVGCRMRVTTQRPRCAKDTKTGLATTVRAPPSTTDGSPGRALDPINPRSLARGGRAHRGLAGGRPGVSDRFAALKRSIAL